MVKVPLFDLLVIGNSPPSLQGMSSESSLSQDLGYLARRELALVLDHESPQGRDWMGLADCMGFTYSTVLSLKGERSPTLTLLDEWEKAVGEFGVSGWVGEV